MAAARRSRHPWSVSENLTANQRRKRFKEIERIIRKIDRTTVAGLRDRAIVGLLGNGIVSLDFALRMRVIDYYRLGTGGWIRVKEKGQDRQILLPDAVDAHIDAYVTAAGIKRTPKSWLFRSMWPGDEDRVDTLPLPRDQFLKILARIYEDT